MFKNVRKYNGFSDLAYNNFAKVQTEEQFDSCFFSYLHLFKIKATLDDYKDLNRRYLNITDVVVFDAV